jgi:hypothetical protein
LRLDFPHVAGTHCSSSSIADILRFDGCEASEAMVFGLGFAYQSIEKRGTGGGAFRGLYADFLREASGHLPALATINAEARMRVLSREWSSVAVHCKAAFVENDPWRLESAAQALDKIAKSEAALLEEMRAAAAGAPLFER